jgi:hypothetical protein
MQSVLTCTKIEDHKEVCCVPNIVNGKNMEKIIYTQKPSINIFL